MCGKERGLPGWSGPILDAQGTSHEETREVFVGIDMHRNCQNRMLGTLTASAFGHC